MTARTLRLTKEVRPLLWPWIVVSILGAIPLLIGELRIGPVSVTNLIVLGAFIGIPLLATLPFSIEFQHHTLSALLSQPVDRTKIWADKVMVAIGFSVSAAATYYLNWHIVWHGDATLRLMLPSLLIVTVCSAAYWVLRRDQSGLGFHRPPLVAAVDRGAVERNLDVRGEVFFVRPAL
jgi:hypothetical protein